MQHCPFEPQEIGKKWHVHEISSIHAIAAHHWKLSAQEPWETYVPDFHDWLTIQKGWGKHVVLQKLPSSQHIFFDSWIVTFFYWCPISKLQKMDVNVSPDMDFSSNHGVPAFVFWQDTKIWKSTLPSASSDERLLAKPHHPGTSWYGVAWDEMFNAVEPIHFTNAPLDKSISLGWKIWYVDNHLTKQTGFPKSTTIWVVKVERGLVFTAICVWKRLGQETV